MLFLISEFVTLTPLQPSSTNIENIPESLNVQPLNLIPSQPLDVLKMAELFRARVIDVQPTTLIFEVTGDDDKVTAFTRLLKPYGILEIIRTGLIGLERGEHTIQEHCEEREYYGKNLL